jgi:hypothetical protein
MPNYIIRWNVGYGESCEEITAENKQEAENIAYEYAKEEFENNVDFGVQCLATTKTREEFL